MYNFILKNNTMQKQVLLEMLTQNQFTFWNMFNRLTAENAGLKLNEQTASAGFIYRHVSETMNRFGYFLGIMVNVENTTIGEKDDGRGSDIETSRRLAEQGFEMLKNYIETTPDETWLETIETPFFGTVSRARLFAHILFHNAYHQGQVGLTLARGGMS
jgi:uncharacterized damage-inducible protein DinB